MLVTRVAVLCSLLVPTISFAQATPPSVTVPTVIVTATKAPEDVKTVPASVTAATRDEMRDAGVTSVGDVALYAPNTTFQEFTARKVSNARFRGIGSSPSNPAITTYIDGVPQLNANSSSVDLLDVDQIEFVRGPQSALYGRNTLGGLINITSAKPATAKWTGSVVAPFGNFGAKEGRGSASGPVGDKLAIGLALGHQVREGYTTNDVTGNDLDYRSGTFAKAQARWTINKNWESRTIYTYEKNRDGDYALGDLGAIRLNPFHVARDFEGHTDRDINALTTTLHGEGERFSIHSSTGFLKWKTFDETDLDYTPLPLATRSNAEEDFQFTQEVRLASPTNAPMRVGDTMLLKWQGGLALFTQHYDQDARNVLAPFVLSPQINFSVIQRSPIAAIDGLGIGLFGQGTLSFNDRADLTVGLRFDHESSQANLVTAFEPPIAPANTVDADAGFSDVSPQVAFAYHVQPETMAYASMARGFKAGGFNPAAIPGSEAYGSEHAWHTEAGVKTTGAGGRLSANAAVFYINWDDLQLNVPNPFVPGQFYISNVGAAHSAGVEFDVTGRPHPSIDIFASFGYTNATFGDGSLSSGVNVAGNKVPFTPDYSALVGAQISRAINSSITIYGRAEAAFYGAFHYDDLNTGTQDAYSIANLRVGARARRMFVEGWVKNAGDTRYVPIAIPYPGFAPSGFIGEMGRPRTAGVSVGFTF
ncbi:MAG: TonB-dependent receptor [Vicinamibacterales bacterium]